MSELFDMLETLENALNAESAEEMKEILLKKKRNLLLEIEDAELYFSTLNGA